MQEPQTTTLYIAGMDCASEVQDVENALKYDGILGHEISYLTQKAVVTYDPAKLTPETIVARIEKQTGYKTKLFKERAKKDEVKEGNKFAKPILVSSAVLLALGLAGPFLGIAELIAAILLGGSLVIVELPILAKALKRFKSNPFNADILMALAGIGSFLIGHYSEGAAVLLLYTLAELLEDYTVDRVRQTTKRLAELLPQRVLLKVGNTSKEVMVEDLKVSDVILVKPGWRLPIDGVIVSGQSTLDQASVTGESVPVEKNVGDEVLSGTLNIDGSLEVKVTRPFYDSTTNRIIDLVMEAQGRKANIEKFVDRFSRYYTPTMLVLTILVALIPPLLFNQPFSTWFYRSLVVLIIACPSAFLISTPITVLVGLTAAMRSGILIKGGYLP
ncbi:MAG TPA: HAD-IC family P-type ATPase [Patescibacteria group bacterium]